MLAHLIYLYNYEQVVIVQIDLVAWAHSCCYRSDNVIPRKLFVVSDSRTNCELYSDISANNPHSQCIAYAGRRANETNNA